MTTEREDLIKLITICPTDTDVGSAYTSYAGPVADLLMELKDEIQGLRERVANLESKQKEQEFVDTETHSRLLLLEKNAPQTVPEIKQSGSLSVSDVTVLLDTVLGARK